MSWTTTVATIGGGLIAGTALLFGTPLVAGGAVVLGTAGLATYAFKNYQEQKTTQLKELTAQKSLDVQEIKLKINEPVAQQVASTPGIGDDILYTLRQYAPVLILVAGLLLLYFHYKKK